ncbi:Patatin-like phospholipase domain-containing protein 3 [Myotis davidii]|uniref:Patatin-like phospholipase domain-containing protein 3 n=1 Tax=Myotis davidii TaxID=225400 RepID=L5LC41_MYODS|nr:Patatin-like phospholipase domain-containing protein 3 [Myotis davidii]
MSILHPSFNIVRSLREALHRHLPDNVHQLISGKMCISLTRVSDWENVLVSEFQSKDDVVDALICTSFIPYFCGLIPPTFRGVRYVDGGFTNSVPCFDDKTTITESPFLGEHDSCPEVKSTNFLYMDVSKMSLHFCLENVQLIRQMVFPPDGKEPVCLPFPEPSALNLSLNDGSASDHVVRHQMGQECTPDASGHWEKFKDKHDAGAQVATI